MTTATTTRNNHTHAGTLAGEGEMMNKKLQEKLLDLHSEGHFIRLHVGPYVDGFAEIYEQEDGTIVFSSEVYTDYSLDEVRESDVEVYMQVEDWREQP